MSQSGYFSRVQKEIANYKASEQKIKDDFIQEQAIKAWPDRLNPQVISEWKLLERKADLNLSEAQVDKLSKNKKKELDKARKEIKRRETAREESLASEENIKALHSQIATILQEERSKFKEETLYSKKPEDLFWQRWIGSKSPPKLPAQRYYELEQARK